MNCGRGVGSEGTCVVNRFPIGKYFPTLFFQVVCTYKGWVRRAGLNGLGRWDWMRVFLFVDIWPNPSRLSELPLDFPLG